MGINLLLSLFLLFLLLSLHFFLFFFLFLLLFLFLFLFLCTVCFGASRLPDSGPDLEGMEPILQIQTREFQNQPTVHPYQGERNSLRLPVNSRLRSVDGARCQRAPALVDLLDCQLARAAS